MDNWSVTDLLSWISENSVAWSLEADPNTPRYEMNVYPENLISFQTVYATSLYAVLTKMKDTLQATSRWKEKSGDRKS